MFHWPVDPAEQQEVSPVRSRLRGVESKPLRDRGSQFGHLRMRLDWRALQGLKPELIVQVVVLVILLAIAFAAGYYTRDHVSRKRRAEARRWRAYSEPDWLSANAPANTNEIATAGTAAPGATGELGQMLNRWESRARARGAG